MTSPDWRFRLHAWVLAAFAAAGLVMSGADTRAMPRSQTTPASFKAGGLRSFELLPLEAQAGTGSWDLLAGPSYALFADSFSFYTSAQASFPVVTREELEPGVSLRVTLAPQLQLTEPVALRGAVEARADQVSEEGGEVEPDSGGLVVLAGGDLLVSPLLDLTLGAGARFPVVQALRGHHREGPVLNLALSYDF